MGGGPCICNQLPFARTLRGPAAAHGTPTTGQARCAGGYILLDVFSVEAYGRAYPLVSLLLHSFSRPLHVSGQIALNQSRFELGRL